MASFTGTSGADRILREALSPGIITDPAGQVGTLTGEPNVIRAGAGDDRVEAGDDGDDVQGGSGNDLLMGGAGWDFLRGGTGSDTLISGDNTSFAVVFLDGGSGADRMIGRDGQQFFVVDNRADRAFDTGGDQQRDKADTIVTNLDYRLRENSGVEVLQFIGTGDFGLPERPSVGIGNSHDNLIFGSTLRNVLDGKGGADDVFGNEGRDIVRGGNGNDNLQGNDGRDIVRGQNGQDLMSGGTGQDKLVGGRGDDVFDFDYAIESAPGQVDIIKSGDGAIAFQGAGGAAGDVIRLPFAIEPGEPFVSWTFGGTGEGAVSCVDSGRRTLVRGNMDDDAQFEFRLLIDDGIVRASTYGAADFGL